MRQGGGGARRIGRAGRQFRAWGSGGFPARVAQRRESQRRVRPGRRLLQPTGGAAGASSPARAPLTHAALAPRGGAATGLRPDPGRTRRWLSRGLRPPAWTAWRSSFGSDRGGGPSCSASESSTATRWRPVAQRRESRITRDPDVGCFSRPAAQPALRAACRLHPRTDPVAPAAAPRPGRQEEEGASAKRRPRSVACGQTKEGASAKRRPRSVACGDRNPGRTRRWLSRWLRHPGSR